MSERITEIDMNKYLVIKQEDIDKYIGKGLDRNIFDAICNKISHLREKEGKTQNQYLVLNMDDEIDLGAFVDAQYVDLQYKNNRYNVKDIAVDLVNAILKAKGDLTRKS